MVNAEVFDEHVRPRDPEPVFADFELPPLRALPPVPQPPQPQRSSGASAERRPFSVGGGGSGTWGGGDGGAGGGDACGGAFGSPVAGGPAAFGGACSIWASATGDGAAIGSRRASGGCWGGSSAEPATMHWLGFRRRPERRRRRRAAEWPCAVAEASVFCRVWVPHMWHRAADVHQPQ